MLSIFLEFLIAIKSPQALEYFFMNLQTLQVFLKILNIFQEFLQAIQYPPSLRIFLYEFTNTPGFPKVAKYFS